MIEVYDTGKIIISFPLLEAINKVHEKMGEMLEKMKFQKPSS